MMPEVVFISVVRDFAMHKKCTASIWGNDTIRIDTLDNRNTNEPIPTLYNRFLQSFDYSHPTWLVFCHEDFECDTSVLKALQDLSPGSIYGPVGARFRLAHTVDVHVDICGQIEQSNRDGSNLHLLGMRMETGEIVDVLDCCCVIVHSSLVEKHHLRFDEQFTFDLYVEDFCVAAKEKHGVSCRILDFKCRHWSGGTLGERYYKQLQKFNRKWSNVTYASTCTLVIGGKKSYRWLVCKIKNCGLKTWLRRKLWRIK